jgi:DNA polymerase-3 subunit chi
MSDTAKSDVWFYHLERGSIDGVLPRLVQKCRDKGWNALIRVGSDERLDALDTALWTFDESAFLPHGTHRDTDPETQPVLLTTATDNPNSAAALFLVDRPDEGAFGGYERIIRIFDGRDPEALTEARAAWKAMKEDGFPVTYWQQSQSGGWEKKA